MTAFTARRISARVKWVGFWGAFCTATILAAGFLEDVVVDFFINELCNLGRPSARCFRALGTYHGMAALRKIVETCRRGAKGRPMQAFARIPARERRKSPVPRPRRSRAPDPFE